jgi:hypothetical protein
MGVYKNMMKIKITINPRQSNLFRETNLLNSYIKENKNGKSFSPY